MGREEKLKERDIEKGRRKKERKKREGEREREREKGYPLRRWRTESSGTNVPF